MESKDSPLPSEAEVRGLGATALKALGAALDTGASQVLAAARSGSIPLSRTTSHTGLLGAALGVVALDGLGKLLAGGSSLAGAAAEAVVAAPTAASTPGQPSTAHAADGNRTLAIIKCGAVSRGSKAAILGRIVASGLDIAALRQTQLSEAQAAAFYAEHADKPYFSGLLRSVCGPGQPVVIMVLEGQGAVARWRSMLGATNPATAEHGTIRRDYGLGLPDNAAHGSDSPAAAAREIAILFPGA